MELLKSCFIKLIEKYFYNNKIDAVVIGAGTGGGVTGISRKLKENLKNV